MKVLITGTQGFIGRHLVKMIKEKTDWEIVAPQFVEEERLHKYYEETFSKATGDSLDVTSAGLWKVLDRHIDIDAVVHLAALLMIDGHQPEDYFRVNTLGTYNALEFARRNKIPKFIYAMTHSDMNKSRSVYIGDDDEQIYGTNSFENNAIPFITSKIAAANMVDAYSRQGVLNGVNLRLANIRGYGSKDTKYNSPFHQFIVKARRGEDIEVWGNPPKTLRDLIYVKDVCNAVMKTIEVKEARGWYNIGSGKGMTIEEEIKNIILVFSRLEKRSCIIYRRDIEEVRKHSCIFLIDKAKRELGWEPQYSYSDGLMDMRKEMEENEKI